MAQANSCSNTTDATKSVNLGKILRLSVNYGGEGGTPAQAIGLQSLFAAQQSVQQVSVTPPTTPS
ncbi:hypothetical protein AGR1B_Lc10037 [Agrobacterium fabacearum S56]|nr:hypothetical protein AGR1B_Lc10037 [Agrobacterium fabacearum S56]